MTDIKNINAGTAVVNLLGNAKQLYEALDNAQTGLTIWSAD
jgi:hypothetical protein